MSLLIPAVFCLYNMVYIITFVQPSVTLSLLPYSIKSITFNIQLFKLLRSEIGVNRLHLITDAM